MGYASILEFVQNEHLRQICNEYIEKKYTLHQDKLNVFTIASDLYYRENFHSDVICAFLDPSYNHNMGTAFLFAFINMLNEFFKDRVNIDRENYRDAVAQREANRIDILIQSESSKHCIIIENKMNNAGDMNRQIPRYYELKVNQGYTVDAIVYIPLDETKTPDQTSWTDEDKENVNPHLLVLSAYSEKKSKNLVEGWILRCIPLSKNIDCVSILGQYADLIKKLNWNIKDSVMLEELYKELMKFENPQSVQALSDMLRKIPEHMADRLLNRYKDRLADFNKIWKYQANYFVLDFAIEKYNLAIDVVADLTGYHIMVFLRNGDVKEFCEQYAIKMNNDFYFENGRYHNKSFSFYEEQKVIDWIEAFYAEMKKLKK